MVDLSASDKQKILNSAPKVAGALGKLVPTISPLLEDNIKIAELHNWVQAFIMLLVNNPFDKTRAIDLGMQLEMLDSFQPADLLRVQDKLQDTLVRELPKEVLLEVYPTLLPMLGAVISGFYIGKARRAAAIDMSAASQMGHDLKTPINAITGFSHVILKEIDGPITAFQKEDLTSIYEAGKKLLEMINDLSAVMQQDASRIGIYPAKYKVSDLVAEVMADIHSLCASEGHTLVFKLEHDIGTMQGNASKLRWILLSLLLYLSRQGTEWQISLCAIRRVISEQAMLVFRIEGYPADVDFLKDDKKQQVASTEIVNRNVSLATCWRFCAAMGASLMMFEGQAISFEVHVPAQIPSNEIS